LFDVPSVGKDFAVCDGQFVGAGSEYFCDDEQARWGHFVLTLIAWPESKYQVPNVECLTPGAAGMVSSQDLLVLG
jgi:hypothetical protein